MGSGARDLVPRFPAINFVSSLWNCIEYDSDFAPLSLRTFLPRDAMLARYMPSSCVYLSVTLRYCIKTAKHMMTQIIPQDSPGNLHCVSKQRPTFKLSLTLSSLNRFSKFLHCWKAYEICYKCLLILPTSPYTCC